MRILLTGGGTGGSVAPLLAVASRIKSIDPKSEFLFLGTKKGPEKVLCQSNNLPFRSINSGKLRRYLSLRNLLEPFFILLGFLQAFLQIQKFKPDAVLSAGSFVAVPVMLAAYLKGLPRFIHQQDIQKGLANKLMTPLASKITVSLEKSLKDFPLSKVILTGNPVRSVILEGKKEEALNFFNLKDNLPVLLIIGGGTGALKLNQVVFEAAKELVNFIQIIHLTGRGKGQDDYHHEHYHSFEFLDEELALAYAASDLVISRAGMGVLSELAILGKPTILVPMPQSHQSRNAQYFEKNKAAIIISQGILTPLILTQTVRETIKNDKQLKELSHNILKIMKPNADELMAQEVLKC